MFQSVSTPLQTWLTGYNPSLVDLKIYEYTNIKNQGGDIYELGAQRINDRVRKDLGAVVALNILQGTSLHLWTFKFLFKVVWNELEALVPQAFNSLCLWSNMKGEL